MTDPTKGRWYRWTVTLWLHNLNEDLETLVKKDKAITYFVAAKETCPTTKTLHWQSYVEFKYQVGMNRLARLFGTGHKFLPSKGDADSNRVYSLKEVGAEVFEIGKAKKQGERTDLAEMAHALLDGDKTMMELTHENPEKIMQYRNGWRDILGESLRKRARIMSDPEIIEIDAPSYEDKVKWIRVNEPDAFIVRDENEWGAYKGQETIVFMDGKIPNYVRYPLAMELPSRYANLYPGWSKVVTFKYETPKAIYIPYTEALAN